MKGQKTTQLKQDSEEDGNEETSEEEEPFEEEPYEEEPFEEESDEDEFQNEDYDDVEFQKEEYDDSVEEPLPDSLVGQGHITDLGGAQFACMRNQLQQISIALPPWCIQGKLTDSPFKSYPFVFQLHETPSKRIKDSERTRRSHLRTVPIV